MGKFVVRVKSRRILYRLGLPQIMQLCLRRKSIQKRLNISLGNGVILGEGKTEEVNNLRIIKGSSYKKTIRCWL